ncbi:hypothetical protein RJ640_017363 [Escallonia rubra]|uniref:Uncharacterized protein n=1 Tax=Escallonia rubra TaxID=112253 RepID=A0AA88U8S0_9ASTE|nr:hypothetical protein RJ640_017363 [Escallonia rubra]
MAASLRKLEDLLEFNISSNFMSGLIPSAIASLKATSEAPKEVCRTWLFSPWHIIDYKGLEILDLSDNNLSGIIPNSMIELSHLGCFNVITEYSCMAASLGNLKDLLEFNISSNFISGLTPSAIASLKHFSFPNKEET